MALALLVVGGVGVLGVEKPARATFPGANGDILFFSELDVTLWRMNPDGSDKTHLTEEAFFGQEPAWSADGTKIAFRQGKRLYSMKADGSDLINIAPMAGFKWNPTWYPSGKKVAFVAFGDIYVTTLRANGKPLGEPTKLTASEAGDSEPAVSPDGKKLAFVSNRDGLYRQIYVMKATLPGGPDNRPIQLTHTVGAHNSSPEWSPDGTKIAFASDRLEEQVNEVYVMNSTGSNETRLTTGRFSSDFGPSFSPDGKKIAFTRWALREDIDDYDVWVMDAEGTNPANLTDEMVDEGGEPSREYYPAWQPLP